MAQINNQEMKKAFSDSTKTQMLEQPNNVDNRTVVPVVDITPRKHKIANLCRSSGNTNATSVTIYTTPTNQDFYLTAANISWVKDATATATYLRLNVTVDGASRQIFTLVSQTLTAAHLNSSQNWPVPIKVDRGTAITMTASSAVANHTFDGQIQGYLEDAQ